MDIKTINKTSPYYPTNMLKLKEPPVVLFALGNIDLLNTFCIGVVGARACCEESKVFTKQLVTELCNRNITIVSGMADGIDTIAHETCLETNGKTIAIIGSGFEEAKKRKIFSKILDNNGLIISEYFPDIPAMPYHFPRRNQLLVAISKSIVAIEVHLKSGTMITASEALKQNIPLYTIPGNLYEKNYKGNNLLLTKGAFCICSSNDILEKLKAFYSIEFPKLKNKNNSKKQIPKEFQKIYLVLSNLPQTLNTISQKTKISIIELQSTLTLMELEDLVYKLPNQCYVKKH